MPGPEQRKMELKAIRQRNLRYLRRVYEKREEQKSRSFRADKSVNVGKDNRTTAAGVPISPPVVSNTNHTTKAINEDKMPIYKYKPSSASLKRKAVDINDDCDSEEGDKHRHGREAKKAKPSGGYVPGTGKPYRGTARERPNPPQSGLVGALRAKSTNAPLKRRETVAKQDTKNLNRNTPKPGEVSGVTSRLTQSRPIQDPLGVVGPKAMDEGATNRPQHTRNNATKGAEVDTMVDVKHAPLRALERKSGQDLENKTKKKSKIGPSTAPPVGELKVGVNKVPQPRTSSFFARIQKPGYTAAVPTNVKHVQEVVKEPVPELPKAPQTNVESPLVKEAEAGASGKKRQREDVAGSGRSKKAKLSTPGPVERKGPSNTEKPGESPKGLKNHFKACFANAGLQGLSGVPELLAHYEACENMPSEEIQGMFKDYTDLMRRSKAEKETRDQREKREQLESAVKDKCFIGAHFGQLVRDLKEAEGKSISSYVLLQACGVLFKDESGSPLNGSTPQDSAHFLNELLKRLNDEEIAGRNQQADAEEPSLVQGLFHVERGETLVCKKCARTGDSPSQPLADCYGLKVVLPVSEESITLDELLTDTRDSELMTDYVCSGCNTIGTTTRNPFVKRLPKYLIVEAPRARHTEGHNSHNVRDRRTLSLTHKIRTSVEFPAEVLDLSSLLKEDGSSEAHQYEVFGAVEHLGDGENDGHYVAFRKIQGDWYRISDEKVRQVSEMELPTQGHLFFLRRVE